MRYTVNFNRKWAFSKEADTIPECVPVKWNFVNLPHTWNALDGQDGGNDYYRGKCYYAKNFKKSELPEADMYYLEVCGANSSAEVYLNGKEIARHNGGYSTWRVNMTDEMKQDNLLVIAVDNSENDSVYPQMADFTFYGGLYRDVNIICVNSTHFDLDYYGGPGLKVTPTVTEKDADVELEAYVTELQRNDTLLFTIFDRDGEIIAQKQSSSLNETLTLKDVHLWNGRKDPYLYTAEISICRNDEIIDTVSSRFGCRSFRIDPENGFILNGEEYPLRGVSRHQDRKDIGNALLPEHHKEDMDLICELGATTIRLAHYQHSQYFYDLCDERGIVIWAEIPYISKHMPSGRENTLTQMKELVTQNYNHPSIVVWGLSNEITMSGEDDPDLIENHKLLNDLVHSLDTTRLTTIACLTMCDIDSEYVHIPDVVSYNHYFGWYGGDTSMNGPWFDKFHKKYPDTPIGCSEYGCEALDWHTSNPVQGDYTEEYQAYYHEELIKQFYSRKYLWATHVWNMFDFGADARNEGGENGQNHKGLVTFDRKYKKDAFYAYKAWLSDEPFVHLCGKRYIERAEDTVEITVYSNLPEVELFANGESVGKSSAPDHFFRFTVKNSGTSHLKAVAGEYTDESVIIKVDKFNEKYRLKEQGAILNWFDITEREGYFSLNDKLSDILAVPQGMEFFKQFASGLMKNTGGMAAGFEMNENMLSMLGGFTVIRMSTLMGTAGVELTKEQLLAMNAQLNQIKKP